MCFIFVFDNRLVAIHEGARPGRRKAFQGECWVKAASKVYLDNKGV